MEPDLPEIAGPRYEALWHSGPVGAFYADADGKWLAVNSRWTEITGVSQEDALREQGMKSQVHPADQAAVGSSYEAVIATAQNSQVAFRLLHAERGTRYVVSTMVALKDGDGALVGMLGTLTDDTERRLAEMSLRASEELHRLTIANLPGAAVGLYDRDMRCLLLEGIESQGVSTAAIRGKHISEIAPPESMAGLMPAIQIALDGGEAQGEFHVNDPGEHWTFHTAPFYDEAREITGFMVVAKNITQQRKAEEESRRADTLFRLAFDHAPIGMAIIGMDHRFKQINSSLEAMLGRTAAELKTRPMFDICHADDVTGAKSAFADVVTTGKATAELRLRGVNDTTIWVDGRATLITDDNGDPLHLLVQLQDVTDRHERIGQLEHMVVHDPLTGLANRRGFETALAAQIAVNARYGERGCLMLVDLDNFKKVNDTVGHAVGDELLMASAKALRERLRESDFVARLGGDEFAVVLPERDAVAAQPVARELLAAITAGAQAVDHGLPSITASIGLTSLCWEGITPDEALVRADHAMYAAKHAGKNQVVLYGDDTSTRTGIPTGSDASSEVSKSS